MIKNSNIYITSHSPIAANFIKLLKKTGAKLNFFFKITKISIKQKNYTILKSPHVNKKARDQIKTKNLAFNFKLKNYANFILFYYFFTKKNKKSLNLSLKILSYQKYCYFSINK